MTSQNLRDWIKNKGFDDYHIGLNSRFTANLMTFDYTYHEIDSIHYLVVHLGKGDVNTKIEIGQSGDLSFCYWLNNKKTEEVFSNCSEADFHTMLAHAFIFIRDGNFDYHHEWYSKLQKKKH